MITFLQFQPIYQERVWGGRTQEKFLGRSLPGSAPIGESWEIVDRPEAQSRVANGPMAGMTLRDLLTAHPRDIMGPEWPASRPFPILVKWLDCRDRLSVQVHPPAGVAQKLGGEPKTENWYMARADAGAAVYAGLKAGVTREAFERAIGEGTVDQCLNRLMVSDGDSLLIESGTMHAIDAGNMILEIQQNSDTTYRVYDWGRMGLDGKPRTLHVRESLECLAANTAPQPRLVRAGELLVQCREFSIRRRTLSAGEQLEFTPGEQPRILSVVEGALENGVPFRKGDNLLIPFGSATVFRARIPTTILLTENFSRP